MAKVANIIVKISKSRDKKGKLRGKNKKETKALKGSCVHHFLNKHGKVKKSIIPGHDNNLLCPMCKAEFPAEFYTNDRISEIVDEMIMLNNQNKYMSVAINSGNDMVEYFAQMGAMLAFYKKNAKKVRNVAEKQGTVKTKKNHKRNGSSVYGSWGRN